MHISEDKERERWRRMEKVIEKAVVQADMKEQRKRLPYASLLPAS